jgi:tripartite-type tricarboxylate transporter receptor subunit TctC
MKEIPYNSEGEYLTALLGNHIDVAVMTYGGSTREHVQAKTLRVLCTFEEKRLEELPDVPTVKELGYRSTYGDLFIGTFVPKGTPQNIVVKLADATRKAVETAEFTEKMKMLNMPIKYMNTRDFEAFIEKDTELVKKFLKEKGQL